MGLGICGVVINATSSAAGLMGDFRTGYICLAAPRAMFGAQLVGQLLGAVLTPLAFMLFYKTGQVCAWSCYCLQQHCSNWCILGMLRYVVTILTRTTIHDLLDGWYHHSVTCSATHANLSYTAMHVQACVYA